MATPVVFNAVNYSIPAFGDVGYAQGPGNLSSYLIALASGTLQPTGGLFSLTADANFGPNFGLVALYYKTTTANIATAGQFRLAVTDTIQWRNNTNTLNLPLAVNASDQLTFNGNVISAFGNPLPIANGGTNSSTALNNNRFIISSAGKIVEQAAIAAAQVVTTDVNGLPVGTAKISIANGGTNSSTALSNNRVMQSSGGAIVEAAAITASRALTSDTNGIPVAAPSGVTDIQLGYLLNLFKYRNPNLVFASTTTVSLEAGIVTGTAGDVTVLFTDGKLITLNNTNLTTFNITRNAVLTSGSAQSGLRPGFGAAATNTFYSLYAVRLTDNDNSFVTVGDSTLPLVANYAVLNANFGTGKWKYLGTIRYGDNSAINNQILAFEMSNGLTNLRNPMSDLSGSGGLGMRLAANNATQVTWAYATGTAGSVVPTHTTLGCGSFYSSNSGAASEWVISNSAGTARYADIPGAISNRVCITMQVDFTQGFRVSNASFGAGQDINLSGWFDPLLNNDRALL